MSVTKACMTCGEIKPLGAFFSPSTSDRAAAHGTSKHCKYCHDAGLIEYGYGWPGFGDRFKTPEETVA